MSDGGKGSKPRPFSVTQEEYDNRWDVIFGKDKKKTEEEKEEVRIKVTLPEVKIKAKVD